MPDPEIANSKRVRRRSFLIDPRFQLKYTMIIVLVGVLVSAFLGYLLYQKTNEATEIAVMSQADRVLPGDDVQWLQQTAKDEIRPLDNRMIYYLIGFVSLMALSLFIWGIFITHRVAGPVFIISRYFQHIVKGTFPITRPLRKGDELRGLFDGFTDMLAALRTSTLKEAEKLQSMADRIKNSGVDQFSDLADGLIQMAEEKKEQVKGFSA